MTNASLNTSSAIVSVGVTQIELWISLLVFMFIGNGLIGTIGNTSIAIGIKKKKELRTRFFIIIQFLAVSRAIIGFQSVINVIHRSLRTLGIVSINLSRSTCYLIQFQCYYSLTLEMMFLLTLVVDRTLAVVAYKYYRRLNYKQARTTCLIISAVSVVVKLVLSLIGINFDETIPCLNSLSPTSPMFNVVTMHSDAVFAVIILIVYVYLILYVRVHFQHLVVQSHSGQRGDEARLLSAFNQHAKLIPILNRLVWLHCGLTLTGKIVQVSQTFFPPEVALRIAVYSGVLVNVDVLANTVVLLAGNKELRGAAFPCIKGYSETTTVHPQNGSHVKNVGTRKF